MQELFYIYFDNKDERDDNKTGGGCETANTSFSLQQFVRITTRIDPIDTSCQLRVYKIQTPKLCSSMYW